MRRILHIGHQRKLLCGLGISLSMLGWTAGARASLTTVAAPSPGEASHVDILNHLYGGGFSGSAGFSAPSYTNGAVTATRMDDVLAGSPGDNLNLVFGSTGASTDQFWQDGIASATAQAKFASFSQEFGYRNAGGSYTKLFDVASTGTTGFDVSGTSGASFLMGVPWEWVRGGTGGSYYSGQASNGDGLDHMITYEITGVSTDPSERIWLLFWEDLYGPITGSSDRDFNDLVVELRATVVPLPGAALLSTMGLGMLALKRRLFS